MARILIADDEILVRVGLKAAINWSSYGFEIVGEAGNGQEALAKIRETGVDILLLDIKMPELDGIEVLKKIKEEQLPVKVVILSCHDDYEYVREALRLGAVDYILKLSLNPEQLLELLISLKKELEQTDSLPSTDNNDQLEYSLRSLIAGDDPKLWERQQQLGLKLRDDLIIVLLIKVDNFAAILAQGILKDPKLFKQSLVGLAQEVINDYTSGDCFEKEPGTYVVFFNPRSDNRLILEEIVEHIQDSLRRYLQISTSIGASATVKGYQALPSGYLQAEKALQRRFFMGKGRVFFFQEETEPAQNDREFLFDRQLEEKLQRAVEFNDYGLAVEVAEEFLSRASRGSDLSQVFGAVDEILYILAKELKLYQQSFKNISGWPLIVPEQRSKRIEFFEDLAWWVGEFFQKYFVHLTGLKRGRLCRAVQEAVKYIHSHYEEKVTLAKVARYVTMSENYFSHLFKKETGEGLTEYLTRYRLEKAKEILRSTDLKINEVAKQVGFDNIYYFSNVFKKFTGVTPLEYKKSEEAKSEDLIKNPKKIIKPSPR